MIFGFKTKALSNSYELWMVSYEYKSHTISILSKIQTLFIYYLQSL